MGEERCVLKVGAGSYLSSIDIPTVLCQQTKTHMFVKLSCEDILCLHEGGYGFAGIGLSVC